MKEDRVLRRYQETTMAIKHQPLAINYSPKLPRSTFMEALIFPVDTYGVAEAWSHGFGV